VYLVTDGVLDLPGGERGLPFGRSRLAELIEKIAGLSFPEAESQIVSALAEWQGRFPQRDDLSFVGFGIDSRKED
jgi:serine phosphatase RsbU (regulator of sigma subunit)